LLSPGAHWVACAGSILSGSFYTGYRIRIVMWLTEYKKRARVSASPNKGVFSSSFLLMGTFTIYRFSCFAISEDVYSLF
jgi:hypothetical protein